MQHVSGSLAAHSHMAPVDLADVAYLKDLITDWTTWSEVEILSLVICSCIPSLRSIAKKFPHCNRVLGLTRTSSMARSSGQEQRSTCPPLAIKNDVRTGLTPSTGTPATNASSSVTASRRMSMRKRQSLRRWNSFFTTGWSSSSGPIMGRSASLLDSFPRQLPHEPNELGNTVRADDFLRTGLSAPEATETTGSSKAASRIQSPDVAPEELPAEMTNEAEITGPQRHVSLAEVTESPRRNLQQIMHIRRAQTEVEQGLAELFDSHDYL